MLSKFFDKVYSLVSRIRAGQFAYVRREYCNIYTPHEVEVAYMAGAYATIHSPDLVNDKEMLQAWARFYREMDLMVDVD